jgi:hypothetical protein
MPSRRLMAAVLWIQVASMLRRSSAVTERRRQQDQDVFDGGVGLSDDGDAHELDLRFVTGGKADGDLVVRASSLGGGGERCAPRR